MITVLIRVEHGAEALAATLGFVIPAVVDGLVADAVVLCSRPDETVVAVAEAVGATLSVAPTQGWREGAALAKRDWLFCLEDGDMPSEGWIRTVERFVALSRSGCRFGRLERRRRGLFGGIVVRLRETIASPKVQPGDVVHRSMLAQEAALQRPVRIRASIDRDPVFGGRNP
jgi:hypothetical protein